MLGLRSKALAFEPPPCICDEIEARVRVACAMRDEMARWPTPLEEWKQLQAMPVLQVQAPEQQVQDRVGAAEARVQAAEERVNKAVLAAYAAPPVIVPQLANPALCPHPMRRRATTGAGWYCTECGAKVGPIDRDVYALGN